MAKELSVKLKIDAQGNVSGVVNGLNNDLKQMEGQVDKVSKSTDRLTGALKHVGHYGMAAFAGWGLSNVVSDVIATTKEMQSLQASLVTVRGSALEADKAFAQIKQFASQTPYQLAEVTDAFIKMQALGLTASERAMRSYGDTASSMGKSLNQMVEAVADAATGEFERLKEFGIKASSEGDRVAFTFRGVTSEVGKNAAEIENYLMQLGEVNFAGGMARQMQTLGGQLSNLEDNWQSALNALGEASQPAISAAIGSLNDLADSVESAADYMDEAALLASMGLTTALTAKAIPAIWATSTAMNAAMVSAGGFAASMRAATAASLAFAATPLGLGVTAIVGGLAYLALRTDEVEQATIDLTTALEKQNIELSKGEILERAKLLAEYRQELVALQKQKNQGSVLVDINDKKENRLKFYISQLEQGKTVVNGLTKATEPLINLQSEYNEQLGKTGESLADSSFSMSDALSGIATKYANLNKSVIDVAESEAYLNAIRKGATEDQAFEIATRTRWYLEEKQAIEEKDDAEKKFADTRKKAQQDLFKDFQPIAKYRLDATARQIEAENELAEIRRQNLIDSTYEKDNRAFDLADDNDAFTDQIESFTVSVQDLGDAWTETGNVAIDALGSMVTALAKVETAQSKTAKEQQRLDKLWAENESRLDTFKISAEEYFDNYDALTKKQMALDEERKRQSLKASKDMLAASVAMAEEGSRAHEVAHTAYMAMQVAELAQAVPVAVANAVKSVTNAGQGDPYTAIPRAIAMASLMASVLSNIGASLSVGGSTGPSGMVGTGEVGGRLGQSETDTYSLESSLDRMLELESDQYHELKGINDGVRSLNEGIVSAVTGMYTTGFAESVNAGLYSRYGGLGQDFANGFDIPGVDIITGFASSIVDKIFGSGTVAKISNSIFGGKTTVYDPRLEFAGTVLDPDFWAEQTKKVDGGWFSSDKKSTIGIDLNTRLIEQFNQIFDSVEETADAIGEQLGLTEQQIDSAVSGVNLAETLGEISLEGEAEEITERLSEAFSMVADAVGYELAPDLINRFAQLGETYFDTLTRVVTDKVIIEDIFKLSGQSVGTVQAISALSAIGNFETLDYVTLNADIYEVSQSLVKLAGGVSELRDAASDYFSEFFTEEEQFSKLTQDLKDQFTTINAVLPETREGYRALVEAQNLGIESDRARYVTLLRLSDMADQYYDNLEEGAEQSAEAVKQAAQEIASAWSTLRGSFASYTQILGLDDASLVAQQKADLQSVYQAETDAINAKISSINELISTSNESVNSLKSLSSQLSSAFDNIVGQSLDVSLERYSTAQAELLQYASQGTVPSGEELNRLLGIVTQNSTDNYASRADYLRDQMLTANAIGDLNGIVDGQLSAEEQTLQALKSQLATAQGSLTTAKQSLDAQLEQIDLVQEQKELAQALIDLTTDVAEYINLGFSELDSSLDGVIDWNEFKSAFSGLATEETLNKVYGALDLNGNGTISYIESLFASLSGSGLSSNTIQNKFSEIDQTSGAYTTANDVNEFVGWMADNNVSVQETADALNISVSEATNFAENAQNGIGVNTEQTTDTAIRTYLSDIGNRWDTDSDGMVDKWAIDEIYATAQRFSVSAARIASVMNWSESDINSIVQMYGYPEFALGGYTENIGTNEIAGVVHGGEYVAPNHQIKRYPELFAALDKERGFKDGGPVNFRMPSFSNVQSDGLEKIESLFEKLIERIEQLEDQAERTAINTEEFNKAFKKHSKIGMPVYGIENIQVKVVS